MNTMQEMLVYLIQTLGSLYMLIVLLRFLLQLTRADFYNPISQGIGKATNPLLLPLRRVIPGIYGIDMASLVLAMLLQWVAGQLIYLVAGQGLLNPLVVIPMGLIGILKMLVQIYFVGMIVYIVASWIAPFSQNPALLLVRQLVEPAMAPLRKIIPAMGPIDISPIFFFLILNLFNQFLIPALAGLLGVRGLLLGF
ncbi:YggT family protein [Gilvimarinus agarilyticus]|uniref:YggT family protein n=1 Tax=unclassified Gilvimarinus TaxID=2642066 RepID=UPI001C08C3C5|nr:MULTISPECIES: YggT family protein [unclassified Gilvimarinus]MBU2884442.1 YggT family protein [Gilvimarinus agarilyticus]MDO6569578.1 YggT family protein [Gilvimarinus sp. 2_MG-2023]MDO6748097.1 YggT family protein [Gilvimarinus sp. 1_MG-2023]